jgi:hypothetical protein
MSTQDLFDDDWPHTHGTAEGFDAGCRGGACPADVEFGMSCKRAKLLSRSDFRYTRLVKAGHTPAEIAAIIDDHDTPTTAGVSVAGPTTTATAPAVPKPPTPEEKTMPTPNDAAKASKPLTAHIPRIAAADVNDKMIRDWAHRYGIDVNPRGKVRLDVVEQFRAAHDIYVDKVPDDPKPDEEAPPVNLNPFTDVLDETRERIAEPIILSEAAAEAVEAVIDHEVALAELQKLNAEADGEPDFDDEGDWPVQDDVDEISIDITPDLTQFRAAVSVGAGPVVDIPGPQPEWAQVAIAADVERARAIAVMLEQECARLQAEVVRLTGERDTALAAFSTALTKWDTDRRSLREHESKLEELLERDLVDTIHLEKENRTLTAQKRVLEAKVDRMIDERRPWWKRARR